jgi:sugar (pentulose or hexulose) kinase
VGAGLHDSSAALIPYLKQPGEPFVLLSTGTWCIALNPFNHEPLTPAELTSDCLCYLTSDGTPVKAARYFGGYEHEQAIRQLAAEHGAAPDFYRTLPVDDTGGALGTAYRAFMTQLMEKQAASLRLAIGGSAIRRIFVDGGFARNPFYIQLLAAAFPHLEICPADMPQATALGAAYRVYEGL